MMREILRAALGNVEAYKLPTLIDDVRQKWFVCSATSPLCMVSGEMERIGLVTKVRRDPKYTYAATNPMWVVTQNGLNAFREWEMAPQ